MSTEQLLNAHNKKVELLIKLGEGLNCWYRSGMIKDATVKAICNEITKLDALIGSLNGLSIGSMTSTCPRCRQPIGLGDKICKECGFDMQESLPASVKRCEMCQGSISTDSNWCPICGARASASPKSGGGSG